MDILNELIANNPLTKKPAESLLACIGIGTAIATPRDPVEEKEAHQTVNQALTEYGHKQSRERKRAEAMELIATLEPHMVKKLDPFIAKIKLPSEKSRAEYQRDFQRFTRYWADLGVHVTLPVQRELLALWIVAEAEDGTSLASISRMCTAIDYVSALREEHSPTGDVVVRAALKLAASRKPTKKGTTND